MKDINTILQDLYAIDASFKLHEKELRILVAKLLEDKPEVTLDGAFITRLRSQLIESAAPVRYSFRSVLSPFYALGTIGRYVGAAAVLLLILSPFIYSSAVKNSGRTNGLLFQQSIQNKSGRAFGTLNIPQDSGKGGGQDPQNTQGTVSKSSPAVSGPSVTPKSMSPMALTAPSAPLGSPEAISSRQVGGGMGGDAAIGKMMVPPDYVPTIYKYVYTGDAIKVDGTEDKVYKRIAGLDTGDISGFLKNFHANLTDLSTFSSLKLRNITLYEDKNLGYQITIAPEDGTVSIDPNWTKWNLDYSKAEPSLSEATAIDISKQFLSQHRISTANFGTPTLSQMYYRIMNYASGSGGTGGAGSPEAKSMGIASMPVMGGGPISVIFPLKVGGVDVYDQGGTAYGLQVNVEAREKKVSSVYNLTSQKYDSSLYPLETDTKQIMAELDQQTGMTYYKQNLESSPNAKIVEIKVGTPHRVLLRTYNYEGNVSSELYVPALYFPVDSPNDSNFYQSAIVIPIVRDFFQNNQPKPVPLMDSSSTVRTK
ncbi:hypothetical protein KW783_00730 [Candidatus Parcubacteria bacterium]|nr:hypothetical protein [Candidatus Parcubacteria bacterium]